MWMKGVEKICGKTSFKSGVKGWGNNRWCEWKQGLWWGDTAKIRRTMESEQDEINGSWLVVIVKWCKRRTQICHVLIYYRVVVSLNVGLSNDIERVSLITAILPTAAAGRPVAYCNTTTIVSNNSTRPQHGAIPASRRCYISLASAVTCIIHSS